MRIAADKIHNGKKFLPPHSVIRVNETGCIEAVELHAQATEVDVYYEGIICPGFINAHCHLELSHLKQVVPKHTGLVTFLSSVSIQRSHSTIEERQLAMQAAHDFLIAKGTVAIGDISNNDDSLSLKQLSPIAIHTFIECLGFAAPFAEARFNYSLAVEEAFKNNNLSCSITPHAPYSFSEKLLALIDGHQQGATLSIHNQECLAENELYMRKDGDMLRLYETLQTNTDHFQASGKSSLATYAPWIDPTHPLLLVHNTFTNKEDIELIKARFNKAFWCVCPNANQYIENSLPPINLLQAMDVPICIGTDSLASNDQLDICSELNVLLDNFTLALEDVLQWATWNGANALSMQDHLGCIEEQYTPGLLLLKEKGRQIEFIKRII